MTETIRATLMALAAAAKGEAILELPKVFYTEKCVDAARAAFTQYCTVAVLRVWSDGIQIRVTVHDGYRKDSREIVGGFLNYLVNAAAQHIHSSGSGLA
jgi:hypothetical protein